VGDMDGERPAPLEVKVRWTGRRDPHPHGLPQGSKPADSCADTNPRWKIMEEILIRAQKCPFMESSGSRNGDLKSTCPRFDSASRHIDLPVAPAWRRREQSLLTGVLPGVRVQVWIQHG